MGNTLIADNVRQQMRNVVNIRRKKMSDLDLEEIIATKLDNGSMTVYDLLQHWEMKYGIPSWQIDYVKEELK